MSGYDFTINTKQDMLDAVERFGFLPFFAGSIPGFSIEEHVSDDAWYVFFFGILTHSLIQCCPVITALFSVNILIQTVQLRMLFMYPLNDPCAIIATKVQVLQPYQIALLLCDINDLNRVCDAGEDRRDETRGLNPCIVKLLHSCQPALNTDAPVHLSPESIIQRIYGP